MIKKLVLLSCIFILNSFWVHAQNEAKIWYFGSGAGLDFNSGNPVAVTNGLMNTLEGCAVLCNESGQLLFYTDGITVWNRNHAIMLNGADLLGHPSSTQSATIVRKPGSTTIFVVITLDARGGANGLRYSEIDLNLDGGLGGVTATKNILLYTPSCEKLAVVKHSNNTDVWVITHGFGNTTFNSHLLTSNGFSAPVINNIGIFVPNTDTNYSMGYMKASPDGRKIAVCHNFLDAVQLFDFNSSTGVLSNEQTLITVHEWYYGVEFSSNSEVLYVTSNYNNKLFQFDLTATNIPSSVITIHDFGSTPGALQLGPDNKIYVALYNQNYLSSIENPEQLGAACNFQLNAVLLNGRVSQLGLPAFEQSLFFNPAIELSNSCLGSISIFSINTNQTINSIFWNFGDGTTSNDLNPTHVYASSGNYTVTATVISPFGTIVKTRNVIILDTPTATQPSNIYECDVDNDGYFNFDLTQNETTILNGQSTTLFGVSYFSSVANYTNRIKITNPANFLNTTAYQAQTIIAEVYNLNNPSCKTTTTFAIQVFESPIPSTSVLPIQFCDNTSFGTDTDGKVVFDLTQRETAILNGQSSTNFTISYFKDAALTDVISSPSSYVNTNALQTIYVKVTNNQNTNCFATTLFQIEVFVLPIVNSVVSLKQCDDDNDGFSAFNLAEGNELIATSITGLIFRYFETSTEANNNSNPITDFTNYANQTVSTDQIFVRVENDNDCFSVATLNLIVSTTLIPTSFQREFTVCDDSLSSSITDGIATFDFSTVTQEIQALYPVGQVLDITYYKNQIDALAELNEIADISNYTNIGYPNSQDIYVRVDSQVNNECLGLGHHITLKVETPPLIQPSSFTECDEDHDGIFGFDTTSLESNLLNGLTNVTVQYWDANNNVLTSPLPNPFNTSSQVIKVRVTNSTPTACYFESTIKFKVDDLPEAFPIPTSLTMVCDDEINPVNQDGLYAFDTTSFQATIMGIQTGMLIKYYDSAGNSLPSPLPNPFITATQNILVEVINPLNITCIATLTIPFIVKPIPEIELYGEELICSNNPSFTKVIDAGLIDSTTINDFIYSWFLNGNLITGETNYSLTVNTEGTYSVKVSNSIGCSRTRTINVTASDIATINNIEIADISNDNSLIIFVSGLGDYVYSLDNLNYQANNSFYDLEAGVYTVFVKDLNGCGITTKEVSILGVPNYFTPNGDGFNDTWNIKGANARLNANAIIYIFDRYGKLLKQINPTEEGWDGNYNGKPLPSSDYWYSIKLEEGRIVKGHFSLKR